MRFDATGKVSLDHIYTQPDPRAYFTALRQLDYIIPELAKPYFLKFIQEYQDSQGVPARRIVDIGCSYGINAALLKFDASMDELYERYCDFGASVQTRSALLARDGELARSRSGLNDLSVIGLDTSLPALSYALTAGFLDAAVHADLEAHEPTEQQRRHLAGADMVISTGCLGYVTHRTLARVVGASGGRRPWMAHFVLRMFPFERVADSLAGLGYETICLEPVFRQRRFASPEEQSQILDTLSGVGVDPRGMEADGWLYAQLYISLPREVEGCALAGMAAHAQSSRF